MSGAVRTSAWDLAVECVDRALGEGTVPSLVRLGRLGQLGSLPSFVAALGEDDDPSALYASAFGHTRERESLGLAPSEVAAELLVLGRVLDAHGEEDARDALDRCIAAYVARVTEDLSDRARRDPLTGLLNHEAFHARLAVEVARARRYRGRLALVLLDLDRFKELNDRDGPNHGLRRTPRRRRVRRSSPRSGPGHRDRIPHPPGPSAGGWAAHERGGGLSSGRRDDPRAAAWACRQAALRGQGSSSRLISAFEVGRKR
jgi:hypothetical protein